MFRQILPRAESGTCDLTVITLLAPPPFSRLTCGIQIFCLSQHTPHPSFFVALTGMSIIIPHMPRRVKESRFALAPLAEDFVTRLSKENSQLRRKIVRYGLWIMGFLLVYSLTIGSYSLPRIVRLQLQKGQLVEANRRLTVQLINDAHIKALLESDPAYIEYVARTKYRMVYPGETIYRYRNQ
jgi:cell division protein FtsB